MDWDGVLSIALAAGLITVLWKLNRYYERSGVIFAVPFSISRDRAPKFFRLTMFLNWSLLAFALFFSLVLSASVVTSWI